MQVVPQGIESVNGSDVNMGCTSPLVDSGGVMVCNSNDCPSSYLLDGNSPAIDTSTSGWASQLVTVRKNDAIPGRIPFDHVVLTFGFDTAVLLTSIELDLFLCPEWNIGAPVIDVYRDVNRDLDLRTIQSLTFLGSSYNQPSQSSCDSLSTVSIPLQDDDTRSSYLTVYIVVAITENDNIEWAHVGEVRLSTAVTTGKQFFCVSQLKRSSISQLTPSHLKNTNTHGYIFNLTSTGASTSAMIPMCRHSLILSTAKPTHSISSSTATLIHSLMSSMTSPTVNSSNFEGQSIKHCHCCECIAIKLHVYFEFQLLPHHLHSSLPQFPSHHLHYSLPQLLETRRMIVHVARAVAQL